VAVVTEAEQETLEVLEAEQVVVMLEELVTLVDILPLKETMEEHHQLTVHLAAAVALVRLETMGFPVVITMAVLVVLGQIVVLIGLLLLHLVLVVILQAVAVVLAVLQVAQAQQAVLAAAAQEETQITEHMQLLEQLIQVAVEAVEATTVEQLVAQVL
jgi:hypothetical protein